MSFDHHAFQRDLVIHIKNRLGWSESAASKVATIASDVISLTHGGGSHYIQSRTTDKKTIIEQHTAGDSISKLARRHGLSAKTIRRVVSGAK